MLYGQSNSTNHLYNCTCMGGIKQAYRRDALLFFQLKDRRFASVGVKLSPNISLRARPCSTNLISFAIMAALSMMRFILLVLLHSWLANCSLRRFESNAIPHLWKSLFLSSSENLFCISLLSISFSRRRAFMLSLHTTMLVHTHKTIVKQYLSCKEHEV